MHYVMSDIHGMYDDFIKMLKLINFDKDKDKLYILGDIVDRGNQSFKMVEWVIKHVDNQSIFMVLGNHDINCLENIKYMEKSKGIKKYLKNINHIHTSFLGTLEVAENLDKIGGIKVFEKFIKKLPLFLEIIVNNQNYILVHGGLNTQDIYKTTLKEATFLREEFYCSDGIKDKITIIGHTTTDYLFEEGFESLSNNCIAINKKRNIIGIDCGASDFNGALACLRLEDYKEFYI